jgi:predicted RNA-binding protein with TRAM domain
MLNDNCISGFSNLGDATIAQADEFLFSDAGTLKAVTFSNLEDSIFLSVAGDATIAAGGALTIANNAVETDMLNDNVISGQTELAQAGLAAADELLISDGGTLKRYGVDSLAKDALALTTEAAAAVANDYIVFLDGGATGETKKESIADLVSSMAGAGLTATSGQLSVTGNNVAIKADGDALVEGYNYFADASSDATVTMPASPSVGDVVTAKAGNLTSDATITINKGSADHRIDGLEGIVIESPFGAVTMVYVVADNWKIV